jgi:oxygen-independent coproporphyrinogen-3 oxidase
MLWEGSDLLALGVASFGHLSGMHYQNATHWDDYLAAVEAGRLPIGRGLRPNRRELLIREMVLGLKRGWLDAQRLERKFGIDPLEEWSAEWESLMAEGFLERIRPRPVLSRRGILAVDALLPRFFPAATAAAALDASGHRS